MSPNFEEERKKQMERIYQNLDQFISSLGELNRNFETINTIGKEFQAPANVWHQFHKAVMTPDKVKPTMPHVKADSRKRQRQPNNDDDNNDGDGDGDGNEFDRLSNRVFTRPITHRQQQSQDHDYDILSNRAVIQDDSRSITHHHTPQHDTPSNPTLTQDTSRSLSRHHSRQQQQST